jgi:hypothetical protein
MCICAEDELETLSTRYVIERVAAQLECDYELLKPDVKYAIDTFLEVRRRLKAGAAQAGAAGECARTQPSSSGLGTQWVTQ